MLTSARISSSSSGAAANHRPSVGCPHFKNKMIKPLRRRVTELAISLADHSDNPFGIAKSQKLRGIFQRVKFISQVSPNNQPQIRSIEIRDNIPSGFKDAGKEMENNPFNMAHTREGHNDDNETSEFGSGFKEAAICQADKLEVFTRSEQPDGRVIYWNIEFDFDAMSIQEDASISWEPTEYKEITREEFNNAYNPSNCPEIGVKGSLFIWHMRLDGNRRTSDEVVKDISKKFADWLSPESKDFIDVSLSFEEEIRGEVVEMKQIPVVLPPNIYEQVKPECKQECELYVSVPDLQVVRKSKTESGANRWETYEPKDTKKKSPFVIATSREDKRACEEFVKQPNVFPLMLKSYTTKGDPIYDNVLGQNMMEVKRIGRSHGEIPIFKPEGDNYSNRIKHELSYASKGLSPYISIGPDKKIERKENRFMDAVIYTFGEADKDFRKYAKDYAKATSLSVPISAENNTKKQQSVTTSSHTGSGGAALDPSLTVAQLVAQKIRQSNDVRDAETKTEAVPESVPEAEIVNEFMMSDDSSEVELSPQQQQSPSSSLDDNTTALSEEVQQLHELPQERPYNVAGHSRTLCSRGEGETMINNLKLRPDSQIAVTVDIIDALMYDNYHATLPFISEQQRQARFKRIMNCGGSFEMKCDLIIEMIQDRYPSPDDPMNLGAELRRSYNTTVTGGGGGGSLE
jgi:hypothetical protein